MKSDNYHFCSPSNVPTASCDSHVICVTGKNSSFEGRYSLSPADMSLPINRKEERERSNSIQLSSSALLLRPKHFCLQHGHAFKVLHTIIMFTCRYLLCTQPAGSISTAPVATFVLAKIGNKSIGLKIFCMFSPSHRQHRHYDETPPPRRRAGYGH